MQSREPHPEGLTLLLQRIKSGDGGIELLFAQVYDELRNLAGGYLQRESDAWTLQPTAVVNEAYLRLQNQGGDWEDRAHFFGAAARAMRQVLVDAARSRNAQKRGGDAARIAFNEEMLASSRVTLANALSVDEALSKLARLYPRPAQVAEMRYFADMSIRGVALVLGVSQSTVDSDWALAKAWLRRELASETHGG